MKRKRLYFVASDQGEEGDFLLTMIGDLSDIAKCGDLDDGEKMVILYQDAADYFESDPLPE